MRSSLEQKLWLFEKGVLENLDQDGNDLSHPTSTHPTRPIN